jgi:Tfp pilus assembly protein FimV
MSVATDFAPIFEIPERARTQRPLATVTQLYQPSTRSVATPLRLTRRGVVVLSGLLVVLASALIGLAWASAPSAAGGGANAGSVPAIVSVQQGDSLWTIAARAMPRVDPRVEVERLQQLNHLTGVELQPGQLLRTR